MKFMVKGFLKFIFGWEWDLFLKIKTKERGDKNKGDFLVIIREGQINST